MAGAIPDGFPDEITDEQLRVELKHMLEEATVARVGAAADVPWSGSFREILPELQLAIINVALQEISRRETAAVRRSADVASGRALWVAIAALTVALASLLVAVLH